MSNEGKATVITILWTIAFNAGLLVTAGGNKAIGLLLMIAATLIVAVYLHEEGRLEAEKARRRRYEQDCARRTREAMSRDD